MLTFLAQYGREWLQDSRKFMEKEKLEDGLLVGNFSHLASLLTCENYVNEQEKNWSHTWSRILMSRESHRYYMDDESSKQLPTPFGLRSENVRGHGRKRGDLFRISFKRYESKIRRLIDSLPPGLFDADEQDSVQFIQSICSLDLENFLLFLQIKPMESLGTERSEEQIFSACGDGSDVTESTGNIPMNPNEPLVITTRYVPDFVEYTTTNAMLMPRYEQDSSDDNLYADPIHLEPFEFHEPDTDTLGRVIQEKDGWEVYLQHIRVDPSVSRFFKASSSYKPKCLSQREYWDAWRIPEYTPPALGDRELEKRGSGTKGVRFIGYIMEMVRTRLAKWTASVHEDELRRESWTAKIPQDWSTEFRARIDLSMLCDELEKQKGVSYLSIKPREGDIRVALDSFKWTCHEQVLWECQKHLLELISDDEREYGPENMELVMLFLLGFPILEVHGNGFVVSLKPSVSFSELWVNAFLTARSPNDVHIVMKIGFGFESYLHAHVSESDDSTRRKGDYEFRWEEWVHMFEGCMKVLSMDFKENDFREQSTETSEAFDFNRDRDEEVCRESEDIEKSVYVAYQETNRNGVEFRENLGWESNDTAGEEKSTDVVDSLKDDETNCACVEALGKTDENENGGNGATASEGSTKCEDQICKKIGNGGDESESMEHSAAPSENRQGGDDGSGLHDRESKEHSADLSESERGGDDESGLDVSAVQRTEDTTRAEALSNTSQRGWQPRSLGDGERCTCEYRLGKRAEKRIIEGTNTYYWHWEGWKPQPAFREYRFLHELEGSDGEKWISAQEEDEDDVESCLQATGGEEAGEGASNEDGNGDENVVILTDGAEMV
ncbi:hypothetical protein FGB62_156g04 [Gracilaria domingensis]|nr:hypothetical protein FGB62_156g04 [Gracilaria domingensis]